MIEPNPLDDVVGVLGKARQHEAGIAAGCRPSHAAGFQYRHRPAALCHLARDSEAGKAGADHADIDVDIEIQPLARRAGHPGRLVPAARHGLVVAHSQLVS